MSNNPSELLKLAIKTGEAGGATEVIARMIRGKRYQIRFSNSAIDVSKEWHQDIMEVFASNNGQISVGEIQAPTPPKIETGVNQLAKFVSKLPMTPIFAGIEENAQKIEEITGLFDPKIFDFAARAPGLVNTAIQSATDNGAEKVAGVLYFGHETIDLLTSFDIGGTYQTSDYEFTLRAFRDAESSGQDVVVGRNLTGIEQKFAAAGKSASDIANLAMGGKPGDPGIYDLILSPTVGANLFGQISFGANPLLMMIGMSPLQDSDIETQIASEKVSVFDDARIPEGLGSRPFDAEGTPTRRTPVVQKGIFKGVIHNTSSSEFKGTKSTGNSEFFELDEAIAAKFLAPVPTNCVFEANGPTVSLDDMIASSERPTIYITSNWYTRYTNQLESSFSTIPRDGMFLIEKGEIKRPVRKLRLADNLLGMAKRISAMGDDTRQIKWWEVTFPTFIPTIKVDACTMTAATQ